MGDTKKSMQGKGKEKKSYKEEGQEKKSHAPSKKNILHEQWAKKSWKLNNDPSLPHPLFF